MITDKEKLYCKYCGRKLVYNVVSYDEYTGQPNIDGKRCPRNSCYYFGGVKRDV